MGCNEDVRASPGVTHAHGIGSATDVVLNQIGSGHWWTRDPPGGRTGLNGAVSVFAHLTIAAPSIRRILHAAPADRAGFHRTAGSCPPCRTSTSATPARGVRGLIQNTLWWIEYAGLSGIRGDNPSAMPTAGSWSDHGGHHEYRALRWSARKWSPNPAVVAHWQRGNNLTATMSPIPCPAMMDFLVSWRCAMLRPA